MRVVISIIVSLVLCLAATTTSYSSQKVCRVRSNVIRDTNVLNANGLIIVPFAVPVAVPVAVYSPNWYQAAPREFQAPRDTITPSESNRDTFTPNASQAPNPQPTPLVTLYTKHCASCHSLGSTLTPNASNRDTFTPGSQAPQLDLSSPQTRLRAIARVVSDDDKLRMPKSKQLTPSEIGGLIQELSVSE